MRDGLQVLVGSAVGAVAGAALALLVTTGRGGAPERGPESEIARELGALRGAVQQATAAFASSTKENGGGGLVTPAAFPREPAGDAKGGAFDVDALLAGLDARLDRLEAILSSGGGGAGGLAGPTLAEGALGSPDFPPKETVNSPEFLGRHLLWDFAKVAQRYGLPDHTSAGGGEVRWVFQSADGRKVSFTFIDGLVQKVYHF